MLQRISLFSLCSKMSCYTVVISLKDSSLQVSFLFIMSISPSELPNYLLNIVSEPFLPDHHLMSRRWYSIQWGHEHRSSASLKTLYFTPHQRMTLHRCMHKGVWVEGAGMRNSKQTLTGSGSAKYVWTGSKEAKRVGSKEAKRVGSFTYYNILFFCQFSNR